MTEYVNIAIKGQPPTMAEKDTKLMEIAKKYQHMHKYPILLAKVNNQLEELSRGIFSDCEIEFLDITDPNGYRTYQRSAVFLMICAAKEILGIETRIVVEHSLNKNYYCEIDKPNFEVTDKILLEIERKMLEIVNKDIPIEKHSIPTEEGIEIAQKFGLDDKVKFLKFRRTANVNFYKMDWFYDYFYGQIVPSTGYLKVFKLVKQMSGFMLLFPDLAEPEHLNEVKPHDKISKIFMESSRWAKIMKVDTVPSLNEILCTSGIKKLIWVNEALHEKKISNLADIIYQQNKKLVLIAGPSSSGKTTFAKRLGIQLNADGLRPHIISLDDYYLNRDNVPVDEYGMQDFEAIESIDVKGFNTDLSLLMAGEEVELPRFNFVSGMREKIGRKIKLTSNEVIIIEGIHGLNQAIGETVKDNIKFRIFISALTQLNIDDHNRIPTSDTRLIRRLVRDYRHRGFQPSATFSMWPSVARGEAKHIFPYQENADAMFNSALIYEMCVLKQYVEPLLFGIDRSLPEYTEARRLLKFMDSFLTVSADAVPSNSILREFIGGSCFD